MSNSARQWVYCLGALLVLAAAIAQSQENDLTLPPRIEESTRVDPKARATALAPPTAGRSEALDEIVVIGGSEWRLPDLGSTWRARAEDEQRAQRIEVSLLPIYDPARDPIDYDPMRINPEVQRVGFIELFRVQFGGARE